MCLLFFFFLPILSSHHDLNSYDIHVASVEPPIGSNFVANAQRYSTAKKKCPLHRYLILPFPPKKPISHTRYHQDAHPRLFWD
ncbi:hypothetical protein F4820DRAFT_407197 [Hypoxylon rubiginosum]|uniref:Uncharacterized protein n=1 Tax=Hypoxylon rubiginosum TaxID=110542 RepID=A0ACB9ZDV8_9PEZI|nr:hypothetical protein F4820DRAFT_407197 [Hypoxylon rubiginosum]